MTPDCTWLASSLGAGEKMFRAVREVRVFRVFRVIRVLRVFRVLWLLV